MNEENTAHSESKQTPHGSYRSCPMCGATEHEADESRYSGQDAIRRITQLVIDDAPAVFILLHKLAGLDVDPTTGRRYTLEQVGKRIGRLFHGMTRAAVSQRCNKVCETLPTLRYLLTEPNKAEAKRKSWRTIKAK